MASRPNNLAPQKALRTPLSQNRVQGNLVNPPNVPEFGGAAEVIRRSKKSPYGAIRHVGNRPAVGRNGD